MPVQINCEMRLLPSFIGFCCADILQNSLRSTSALQYIFQSYIFSLRGLYSVFFGGPWQFIVSFCFLTVCLTDEYGIQENYILMAVACKDKMM